MAPRARVRKAVTAVMAGLIVVGTGAVASQAGFTGTDSVSAQAQAGTVVVDVAGTDVNFGDNLKGGAPTEPKVIPIEYKGTLGAAVTVRLAGIQITDGGSTTNAATGYQLEYADNADFTSKETLALTHGASPALKFPYTVTGPSTKNLHLRLVVPDVNAAQNDLVKFTLHADANQN